IPRHAISLRRLTSRACNNMTSDGRMRRFLLPRSVEAAGDFSTAAAPKPFLEDVKGEVDSRADSARSYQRSLIDNFVGPKVYSWKLVSKLSDTVRVRRGVET